MRTARYAMRAPFSSRYGVYGVDFRTWALGSQTAESTLQLAQDVESQEVSVAICIDHDVVGF